MVIAREAITLSAYAVGGPEDREPLQVRSRVPDELRSLALLLGPLPFGFHEGRQVLRGEVPKPS